ncbi:nucleotidyltransferase domain-containing protein [Insolitispirillum peregrinum]|uniref:nucleotidyltransferase domain-containing protein n=1 Tax=Insolitispirillum peregrinum TaxID=80876 RepID=UPI003616D0F8
MTMPVLQPEFLALCQCVRLAVSPTTSPDALCTAGQRLQQVRDWDAFVAGAARHRVEPLVLRGAALVAAGSIPASAVRVLQTRVRQGTLGGLKQLGELLRLLGELTAAGIPALVIKGLPLSQKLYGDPFQRSAGDIDLLVPPDRYAEAHQVLISAGYLRLDSGDTVLPSRAVQSHSKDFSYRRGELVLELHVRLGEDPSSPEASFDVLWHRRDEVMLAGSPVACLGQADLLPYLLDHGARHGWDRLCWLADIALLLRDPQQRQCLGVAPVAGRQTGHTLDLLHLWLGDGEEGQGPHTDPRRLDWFLAAFFAGRRWLDRPVRGSWPWLLRELRARRWRLYLAGGWRQGPHVLWQALLNPVDQAVLPLPERWAFLYPLLRPLGWVLRNFGRRHS